MKAGTESKLNATPGEEVANIENHDPLDYSEGESPPAGTGQFHIPFSRLPKKE